MSLQHPIQIPGIVKQKLIKHIRLNCSRAESAWQYANQDEDTLTGDFLGNLRSSGWQIIDGYHYQLSYSKIRGRGPAALEGIVGADGIISIEIIQNEQKLYKSFTFQAKKEGNSKITDQLSKMNKYFPDSNVIFRYSENNFVVEKFKGRDIRICEFLMNYFLECSFGTYGLYYNREKNLFMKEQKVLKPDKDFHQLRIKIK